MLEDLLAADTATLIVPAVSADDSGGVVYDYTGSPASRTPDVPVRCDAAPGKVREMYLQLGREVGWVVYSQTRPGNGDAWLTSDGLLLRVVGVMTYRAEGNLPTYYEAHCEQVEA